LDVKLFKDLISIMSFDIASLRARIFKEKTRPTKDQ